MNKAQKIVLWVVASILSIVCVFRAMDEYSPEYLEFNIFLGIAVPVLIIGTLLIFSLKK